MRLLTLTLSLLTLALAWGGPLPQLASHSFAAHMAMHMAVVAIAAPLLAFAIAGSVADPVRLTPRLFAPIPASLVELVVVWIWHAPAWHQAARHDTRLLALEQISFLIAGVVLWIAVAGGDRERRRYREPAGVVALLLTSMHMTLLGALFALANRPLFLHDHGSGTEAAALADQHLGGVIMLLAGGASYLAGALVLTARALRDRPPALRAAADGASVVRRIGG